MSRRSRGEGTIYQRRDGRWEATLHLGYAGGKRLKKSFYGTTQREVRLKLAAAHRDLHAGMAPSSDRQTVGGFLDQWLNDVVEQRVRPATLRSYEGIVRVHLKPALGRLVIGRMGVPDVQHLLNDASRRGLSPRRVQYINAVLRAALADAMRWGLLSRNVAALASPPRVPPRHISPLSPAEVRALLRAAADDRLLALYALAVGTGIRQGEALGLRWRDVDLEAGSITINAALQRVRGRLELVEPKTARSRRSISLPSTVTRALRQHRLRQMSDRVHAASDWRERDFVFTTRVGTPLDAATVTRSFQRLLGHAGLRPQRFHDLRHACASMLIAEGVHPRVVMEILGHSQISLTMNTYAHVLPAAERDASARMETLLHAESDAV